MGHPSRRAQWRRAGLLASAASAAWAAAQYRARSNRIRNAQARPAGRPPAPGSCRFSVVVPAYREGERIGATVGQLKSVLASLGEGEGEILVVDDGSRDATAERAREAGAHQVIVHPHNRGKGAAVRTGVLAARGRTVAFTDSDLSYSPEQLLGLLAAVESGYDVVVGSRKHIEAITLARGRRIRELSGRVFNALTMLVLLGRYRDTQCGLKAFRSDVARTLFAQSCIEGFAFDVELFALAEYYGLSLEEVPVSLSNSDTSTVRIGADTYRMVRDVFRIRRLLRSGHYWQAAENPAVAGAGSVRPVMATALDTIFKAYDIRGTVPDQLDAPVARAIGAAFARFTKSPRVLVARDMRESGEQLASAFAAGVNGEGADVVDLGLASTDLVYFAAGHLDAPAAMFTASHNPARYNGIKLCLAGARPVGQDTGLAEIKSMAASMAGGGDGSSTGPTGAVTTVDLLDRYGAHVRSFVDPSRLRPLKVVADTANGMGGLVVPKVFDGLPFDLEILFPELDGSFPNHPADPIQPENLKSLQARVLDVGADVGLAFDGDADRVFLVDERAEPVSGSTTTSMVARAMLDKHPGSAIIYNLICSKAVPEVISENGGRPVRTRVGHSFIKSVMAETDAVFGGEHSGHYYFRDNYRADSGLIAAVVVLELLSMESKPLSELRKPFERYAHSGEINVEVDDPVDVIERVAGSYRDAGQERIDGLTVDFGDWWFNLRPSNTEPLLRLNLEAPDAEACRAHLTEVLALIKEGG